MEIQFDENLTSTLEMLATAQHMTSEEYASNVVTQHVTSQLRQQTVSLLTALDVVDLSQVKSDVTTAIQAKRPVETTKTTGIITK